MRYNLVSILSQPYAVRQRDLIQTLRRELQARETPIRELIDAIYYRSMNQPGATPTLVIEYGFWYGAAIGVFLERYRENGRKFDLTNVAAMFISDVSEERRKLMDALRIEIQAHDPAMLAMLYTIAQECEQTRNCNREKTIEIAMRYGLVVGILAEKEMQRSAVTLCQ